MNYAFTHQSDVFTPDGRVDIRPDQVDAFNREQEARELAALQAHPDKAFLYVKLEYGRQDICKFRDTNRQTLPGRIRTWLGTELDARAWFGPRRYIGFGHRTYRRAVTCTLFGVAYYGWFYESSGDYCRLTRSKGKKVSK